ncbi:MAG: FHA domain-containing protein [Blastocatellia bacterium]|nr:FHA domain-containing protein [Blastocatellia bacterium]
MDETNAQSKFPYVIFAAKNLPPTKVEITGMVFSIGRGADNDLQISDTLISRKHAEIVITLDGQYKLRDRGSKSGTYIRGERVDERILEPGDEIVLGDASIATLRFEFPSLTTTGHLSPKDTSRIDLRLTARQTRFVNLDLLRQPGYVTSRTLERLTSLYEITHALLPLQFINELTETWLDALFRSLPVERGAIFLLNPVTQKLEMLASRDKDKNKDARINVSTTIIEQTFHENVAIRSSDAMSDERFSSQQSVIIQKICSVLSAPISSKQRVWGVCYLYSHTPGLFDSEDLEFLMATAREAGLVIENLRLTEELRATQEQLIKSERLATIGKITSSISHELRNRLALLSGAKLLEMKFGNDPEVKQFTDMVLTGQRRALALVEEIREFARNRPLDYEKASRSITPTIERTVSLMRLDPIIAKRSLQFSSEDVPNLQFNDEKIEQVLINLIRNAAEATPENKGIITVTLRLESGDVVIRVADNGSGIPPEILPRIWEPFFTTKGDEGTGLGLEICRRIIEAHGGTISCESEVGRGTCFIIRLPIRPETEELSPEYLQTATYARGVSDQAYQKVEKVQTVITPERLGALPKEWLTELNQAMIEGDVEAANRAVLNVQTKDPELAEELRNFVKNYQFDEIIEAIEKI